MKNKKIILIIAGVIIFIIDQITKALLIEKNFIIIPNILDFTYTKNTGAAFGIGSNNIFFIILVNVVILGFIIKFLKGRKEDVDFKILISLVLILTGGIGNLVDRIFRGYVVDFIDINIFNFPNFNIADISITLGIIILMFCVLKMFFIEEKNDTKGTGERDEV